jgi:hypothetical protein
VLKYIFLYKDIDNKNPGKFREIREIPGNTGKSGITREFPENSGRSSANSYIYNLGNPKDSWNFKRCDTKESMLTLQKRRLAPRGANIEAPFGYNRMAIALLKTRILENSGRSNGNSYRHNLGNPKDSWNSKRCDSKESIA